MPVGETILEILLRGIFEVIFFGVTDYTGAVVLTLASCGRLRLAPLDTFHDRNRGEKWWSWSIWLQRPGQGRALRAEAVSLFGMLVFAAAGAGIYFFTNRS
jgi:hypothetical protein